MTSSAPEKGGLIGRLSVMMFLQYAIWGAWLPLFFAYLTVDRGFKPEQAGMLFGVSAVGALIAPFIFGQIADRILPTERLLAVLHIVGAGLMWKLGSLSEYSHLVVFGLIYSMCYSPTMALTNSLAFHHLPDRDRQFPKVRLWGTIGWIVVGIGMGQWLLSRYVDDALPEKLRIAKQVSGYADSFKLASILGLAMGLYSLTLPHTPPSRSEQSLAFAKAAKFILRHPLVTLFLVSFPVACIHHFYVVRTVDFLDNLKIRTPAIDKIFGIGGGPMTIGQIAEILVLASIPALAKIASRKTLLLIGLAAYVARFAVFAYAPSAAAVFPALALHGLCFGCVFFVSFMIIDEETPADVRATAQSLFNLVIVGIGIIVGNISAGWIGKAATLADGTTDYRRLFAIPMWVAVGCFMLLLLLYPSRKKEA